MEQFIHDNTRYYDPVIGRFISPDPMISDPYNPQTLNKYSYVNNNPVNFTDLTGEGGLGSVFSSIGSTISSAWKSVVSGVSGAAQRLGNWLQQNVWTPLGSALAAIPSMISNLIDQVSDTITSAAHRLVQWSKIAVFDTGQFFSNAWEIEKAILGFTWASVGVMGLDIILTGLAYLTGSEVEYIDGAIVVKGGFAGHIVNGWFGMDGITLGNTVFAGANISEAGLYHELQHVKQFRLWGVAWIPTYIVQYSSGVISYYLEHGVFFGHYGYCNTLFEEQAYEAEYSKYNIPSENQFCSY